MTKASPNHRPHLFVLRLRLYDMGDGKTEWRGDIEYAVSREKCYFREWSVLLDFLVTKLQAACADDFPPSATQ